MIHSIIRGGKDGSRWHWCSAEGFWFGGSQRNVEHATEKRDESSDGALRVLHHRCAIFAAHFAAGLGRGGGTARRLGLLQN